MVDPGGAPDAAPRPAWADEINLAEVGLVARLLRIHLLFGRFLDTVTTAAGVNVTDYLVLALIERSPDGGSPTHLAEVLARSSGGMTLTLDRLASMGWVTRSPDPGDRRRVRLHLTADGLDVVGRIRGVLHAWEDALPLSESGRGTINRQAEALLDLLGTTIEGGAGRRR